MNHETLHADLIRDEGIRLKPYTDSVGKLTIGIGRNLDDRGISLLEAKQLLENDIAAVVEELDNRLGWWKGLSEPRQRALANMAFNMGVPRLLGFEKMLRALEAGDGEKAALEALDSRWARQVGDRAQRIAELLRSA